jgi:hypothetical protein
MSHVDGPRTTGRRALAEATALVNAASTADPASPYAAARAGAGTIGQFSH